MKKLSFILVLCCCLAANAQHNHGNRPPQPRTSEMVMRAQHDEQFVIYVDGDLINRNPQNYITFQLTPGQHDIYVVLRRPADKITMFNYVAQSLRQELKVAYNPRTRQLEILDMNPANPGNGGQPAPPTSPAPNYGGQPAPPAPGPMVCSDEDVDRMVSALQKEAMDGNRLLLAQTMVEHNSLTARQICRLAHVFAFDDNRLEFLKRAYSSCVDKGNYYQCAEELTFSKNKEALLKYIR